MAVAYVLALQGLMVAWGVVAAIAAHAGLPPVFCASDDAAGPTQRSDAPPCCPCGPLCGSGPGTDLTRTAEAAAVFVQHPPVAASTWLAQTSEAALHISSDPRKARAPPVSG